jgi:FMN-dependent NADH-azoreductase
MAHLLYIDSSVLGDNSVSRKLSAHTAGCWHATHPDSTTTYRHLAQTPIPHLTAATGTARAVPGELCTQHNTNPLPSRFGCSLSSW